MSVTGSIIAGVGAAGALGGAAISSNAAGKAASTQATAADQAAELQHEDAQAALNFEEQQWLTQQGEISPFIQSGQEGVANLDYLLGIGPNPGQTGAPGSPLSNHPGFSSSPGGPGGPLNLGEFNAPKNVGPVPFLGGVNSSQSPGGPGGPPSAGRFSIPTIPSIPGRAGSVGSLPDSGSIPSSSALVPGSGAGVDNQFSLGGEDNNLIHRPTTASLPGPITPSGAPPTGNNNFNLSSAINPNLGGYGSLLQQWNQQFQAPTAEQAAQTPGYQFQLQQGQKALENSAAARGGLLSGNTAEALDQYSQGLASTNYQQAYNNALTQYQQSYNQFQQGQANQFNRLASIAGIGQVGTGQLSSAGSAAGNNISNLLLGSGSQIGQSIQNAAAARASGFVGGANALSGGLSSIGGLTSLLPFLTQPGANPGPSTISIDGVNGGE